SESWNSVHHLLEAILHSESRNPGCHLPNGRSAYRVRRNQSGEFMAKELIISANVHEKKVAMLEDGVVTEFYVERRDENQGVVGNLYKGRVMKVLPGMQSAFVDIGLERDAFLYVSDFTEFMEEEEEIDFREVGDEARMPPPRVDDRARRG